MKSLYLLVLFIFSLVCCQTLAQSGMTPECCKGKCCFDYLARLNASPDSVKPIYDHLRTSNADKNVHCCRQMLHRARIMLAERLPWHCSVNKLVAVLGEPDRIERELTYLEKTDYGKKIPLRKRWFKKQVYRYNGGIPGRIYLLFIIRSGRVIFWKDYADIC